MANDAFLAMVGSVRESTKTIPPPPEPPPDRNLSRPWLPAPEPFEDMTRRVADEFFYPDPEEREIMQSARTLKSRSRCERFKSLLRCVAVRLPWVWRLVHV